MHWPAPTGLPQLFFFFFLLLRYLPFARRKKTTFLFYTNASCVTSLFLHEPCRNANKNPEWSFSSSPAGRWAPPHRNSCSWATVKPNRLWLVRGAAHCRRHECTFPVLRYCRCSCLLPGLLLTRSHRHPLLGFVRVSAHHWQLKALGTVPLVVPEKCQSFWRRRGLHRRCRKAQMALMDEQNPTEGPGRSHTGAPSK